jgi:hypothetical protein
MLQPSLPKTMTFFDQDGKLKVEGVYFMSGGAPSAADANCRVKGVDGITSIQGTVLGADESTLRILTPYAKSLPVRTTAILEIWFLGGRSLFLSDLKPVKVKEESPWGKPEDPWVMIWHYKNDLNCRRQPLLLGGKTFKRGVGVHAKCELTYAVPEGYTSFESLVGIDDRVAPKAKEILAFGVSDIRVLVDGQVKFEKRISGNDQAASIKVAVAGAKTITLIADYGETAKMKLDEKGRESPSGKEQETAIDFGDWVNFAEARFSK